MSEPIRAAIVAEARRWLGVRFRHGGRSRDGVDCLGLLMAVYGVDGPGDYDRRPGITYSFSQASRFADRINHTEAGPGDVAQMCYAGHPVHFGIMSPVGVIHAAAMLRKVVEHAIITKGEGRVVACWRIKGVPPWRS